MFSIKLWKMAKSPQEKLYLRWTTHMRDVYLKRDSELPCQVPLCGAWMGARSQPWQRCRNTQYVRGRRYLFPGSWAITALSPSPTCPVEMYRSQCTAVLPLIHQPPHSKQHLPRAWKTVTALFCQQHPQPPLQLSLKDNISCLPSPSTRFSLATFSLNLCHLSCWTLLGRERQYMNLNQGVWKWEPCTEQEFLSFLGPAVDLSPIRAGMCQC